jgi:hypothetical protein
MRYWVADDNLHDGFIRQRRNLIASSLLLAFILYGGVELSKVNLLGNEITFTDPTILRKSLMITWLPMAKSQDARKNSKKAPLKTADEKRKEKREKKNK